MVKVEQKNYEPTEDNIHLSGLNTVCLRREWCFNVFTGLAHKSLWRINGGEVRQVKFLEFRSRNSEVLWNQGGRADTQNPPCVMLDLGTGAPSDFCVQFSPDTATQSRAVTSIIWCIELSKLQTTRARAGGSQEKRLPCPYVLLWAPEDLPNSLQP